MKSDPSKFIYTEDLDYSKTSKQPIWGGGDPKTLQFLTKLAQEKKLFGNWLHFAAGDGRYNNILLNEVDKVVATDIDKGALNKLQEITPKEFLPKLTLQTQDITKTFPFKDKTFDGVFNTGTLHLFPKAVLEMIIKESFRVLKPNGTFIFDFATDIKRIKKDGTFVRTSDIDYSKSEAKTMLSTILDKQKYITNFVACGVSPEEVTSGSGTYMFSCNYWLVLAEKQFELGI